MVTMAKRRASLRLLAMGAAFSAAMSLGLAGESNFPFERELMLDARPMRGSKRLPSLEVAANGAATIELWCNSIQGQVVVAADTITIISGPITERSCAPDRTRGDDDLLAALTQATRWRVSGDFLVLTGPTTLRYRLQTN